MKPPASSPYVGGGEHLDALMERALASSASDSDLRELQAHTKNCPACAALLELGPRLAAGLVESKPDQARDERAVARALAGRARPTRTRRAKVVVGLSAAAVLFGSLAAARYLGVLLPRGSNSAVEAAPKQPPAAPNASEARVEALPAPATAQSAEVTAALPGASRAAAAAAPSTFEAPSESASELFALGNQLRRSGRDAPAIQAYRRLQQAYPQSGEATVSHATLGALLMQRGDAKGALAQFDGYVGRGGPVLEEALAGRARALQVLGDRASEAQAWQRLLGRFPSSVHGARARARLAELR